MFAKCLRPIRRNSCANKNVVQNGVGDIKLLLRITKYNDMSILTCDYYFVVSFIIYKLDRKIFFVV